MQVNCLFKSKKRIEVIKEGSLTDDEETILQEMQYTHKVTFETQ